MMLTATSTQKGDPYEDLSELYGRMLGQWTLEMNHVAALVGGFDSQQKNVGQHGVIFTPVAKTRQAAAVAFLNDNAFATPQWAIDKEILRRIEPLGAINRVGNAQRSILTNLLNSAKFARLIEQEALDGSAAYKPADFLVAVRHGVWHEVEGTPAPIDAYRRQLQRSYLDLVNAKLNGPGMVLPVGLPAGFPIAMFASSGDEKPYYRGELHVLNTQIVAAIARTTDRGTRVHLEAARDQIARILDPKFNQGGGPGAAELRIFADRLWGLPSPADTDLNSSGLQIEDCWPDYEIKP